MKDKPNKLDDAIRDKMANLGSPYRPETWDRLSERLDADAASADPLDDMIRDKMANLAAPYLPDTWDWMNDRLDAEEVQADPIDEIVRTKMADFGVPYRAETWDWMNDRLDDMDEGSPAGAELQTMDEAIYERMHRLEKSYDPNHWPMLLKKLEGNAYVGEHIVRYKAMELSLLLLLLLTFVRLPLSTETPQPFQSPEIRQTRPQAQNDINSEQNNTLAEANTNGTSEQLTEATGSQPASTGNARPAVAGNQDNRNSADPVPQELDNQISDVILNDGEQFGNQELQVISGIAQLPSPTRTLTVPNQKIKPDIFPEVHDPSGKHAVLGVNPANVLGVMTYLPSGMARPLCLTCTGQLDQKAREAKQTTFFRIGMQGGPDYNRVITPSTLVDGDYYQADRYSLGYSGGLTMGLEKGRWEIETGLMYSNKSYYSLPILVLDGSVEDGFFGDGTKQFDLEVFQVPMNFRYNFFRKNRWRIYGMAGVSLHVTTQSNYYLAEADGFATGSFRPQPTRPGEENSGRNAPSIKSEFDNFTKGWLEGGRFSENSYITGNVGFGIERFLTDYWSIYAQPTYSHSLMYLNNGLGPYYDRIHTNSVIFGFKVRLK